MWVVMRGSVLRSPGEEAPLITIEAPVSNLSDLADVVPRSHPGTRAHELLREFRVIESPGIGYPDPLECVIPIAPINEQNCSIGQLRAPERKTRRVTEARRRGLNTITPWGFGRRNAGVLRLPCQCQGETLLSRPIHPSSCNCDIASCLKLRSNPERAGVRAWRSLRLPTTGTPRHTAKRLQAVGEDAFPQARYGARVNSTSGHLRSQAQVASDSCRRVPMKTLRVFGSPHRLAPSVRVSSRQIPMALGAKKPNPHERRRFAWLLNSGELLIGSAAPQRSPHVLLAKGFAVH